MSKEIVVVIPCFNEETRLSSFEIDSSWVKRGIQLLFVDDGSTDRTRDVLENIRSKHEDLVNFLLLAQNVGKGEAVRYGMNEALSRKVSFVGYMDADLSTPFSEMGRLIDEMTKGQAKMVLGSRVKRLGAQIKRKAHRHICGRILATIVAHALGIGIYDPQCGAKMFANTTQLQLALKEPFSTRWVFDVELIDRLIYPKDPAVEPLDIGDLLEIPLTRWQDIEGSKITIKEALRLGVEMCKIGVILKRNRKAQ